MTKINENKLKADLAQFTGTEHYYYNPLFRKFRYTNGIKYLAENAGCYWLLDYIFSNQHLAVLKEQPFQVWEIKVREDKTAKIIVEDGNNKVLKSFSLDYTDFPMKEYAVWLIDTVLILPSEY